MRLPRQNRIARLAGWLAVLALAVGPVFAANTEKDLTEIKADLTNLVAQVQGLQSQIAAVDRKASGTDSLRADLSVMQTTLGAVRTAVEARAAGTDTPSPRQAQLLATLSSLSNQLAGAMVELKAASDNNKKLADAAVSARNPPSTSGLEKPLSDLNEKVKALDERMGEVLRATKDQSGGPGSTGTGGFSPADIALLSLVGLSLVLTLVTMLVLKKKLSASDSKMDDTKRAVGGLRGEIEGRIKTLEVSGTAVQGASKEVAHALERVESAIKAQLELVSKKINSSHLSELVEDSHRSAEQMAQLRAETAALQKFMNELRLSTRQWMDDFAKQTGNSMEKIKAESHSLDKLIWPEPFRADDKFSAVRERIHARANAGDKTASALMLALGQFQLAVSAHGEPAKLAECLDHLGTLAYRFWKEEPGAEIAATFDAAQAWAGELNKILTANNLPLGIRVIMPRAGFDMSTMLSEQSVSGSTSRVREPLSWAVVSKGGDQQKVLVTGKVITE
jgi:prefoldin subunit 5